MNDLWNSDISCTFFPSPPWGNNDCTGYENMYDMMSSTPPSGPFMTPPVSPPCDIVPKMEPISESDELSQLVTNVPEILDVDRQFFNSIDEVLLDLKPLWDEDIFFTPPAVKTEPVTGDSSSMLFPPTPASNYKNDVLLKDSMWGGYNHLGRRRADSENSENMTMIDIAKISPTPTTPDYEHLPTTPSFSDSDSDECELTDNEKTFTSDHFRNINYSEHNYSKVVQTSTAADSCLSNTGKNQLYLY